MIEQVVKIVKILSLPIALFQRKYPLVSGIETRSEPSKQPGHGNVCLTVTVIYRRIENNGLAGGCNSPVAAPQVSMQQRSGGVMIAKELRQSLQQAVSPVLQFAAVAVALRQLELIAQTLLREELQPAVRGPVDLWCAADGVIPVPAEPGPGIPVLQRQRRSQFGARLVAPGAKIEVLKQQPGLCTGHATPDRRGDANGAWFLQFPQTIPLRFEHILAGGPVQLQKIIPVVCSPDPVAAIDAAAAHRRGAVPVKYQAGCRKDVCEYFVRQCGSERIGNALGLPSQHAAKAGIVIKSMEAVEVRRLPLQYCR